MCAKLSLGFAVHGRCRHCIDVGGSPAKMAVIVTVFEAAGVTVSEPKTEDNAAAKTQPGALDVTVRRRSSGPEVYSEDAFSVPGRFY